MWCEMMEDKERTCLDFTFTVWIRGMFLLPPSPVGPTGGMYNAGQTGKTSPVLESQNTLSAVPRRTQF